MSFPSVGTIAKAAAISVAIGFLYSGALLRLGHQWWTDENYSHGLLVPFVIAYFAWTERERLFSIRTEPAVFTGAIAIVLSCLVFWAGTAGAELYTQRMSFIFLLAGIALFLGGKRVLWALAFPLALLALAVPIPAIIFNRVAFPLQLFASKCAVWVMSALSIPVLRQGNVIELKPLGSAEIRRLEVVEACSGIRSLMTLVTLAVVLGYFTRGSRPPGQGMRGLRDVLRSFDFWRGILIVGSAVPIAIVMNALRVSGTGVLAHYYGTRVADGFFHSFSGWVVYVGAFLLLFGFASVLDRAGKLFRLREASRSPEPLQTEAAAQGTD